MTRGTLYYDGTRSSDEVGKNDDFDHDEIDDLLFIPDDDFEGTVTIPFKGEADSGESISGDLVIVVGDGKSSSAKEGDVTYNIDVNDEVYLDVDDFDDYVYDSTRRARSTMTAPAARTRSAKTTISIMTKLTICSSSPMMTTRAL